jgi:O-antigen ligase
VRAGLLLIVLSPVAVVPGGLDRYTWPTIAVAATGAALVIGSSPRPGLPRPVLVLLGVGAGVHLAAALASGVPLAAFLGRAPRYEGVLVLAAYAGCLVAGAATLNSRMTGHTRRTLTRAAASAVLLAAGVGVLAELGLELLPSANSRTGSLLGNATSLGLLGVLLLPLLVSGTVTRPLDRWCAAGSIGALVCVVLSGSRAVLGACVLMLLALAVAWRSRAALRLRVLGLAGLCAVAALLLPVVRDRVLGSSPLAGSTMDGRTALWEQSLSLLRDHPVLGVGPGRFADEVVTVRSEEWYRQLGVANPPDSPHNLLLSVGTATGLVGLVALAVAGVVVVRAIHARLRAGSDRDLVLALVAGLAAYTVVLLAHPTDPVTLPLAALLLGGVLSRVDPVPVERAWRLALTWSAAVVAVVALAASAGEVSLARGVEAVLAGDLDEADDAFEGARTLRPWDADVAVSAGHALLSAADAGHPDPALVEDLASPWVRRAHGAVPDDPVVMADRVRLAELSGDLPEAVHRSEELLARDPHQPEHLLRHGVLLAETGDRDGAEQAWLRATRIAPRSPDPWANLAVLYEMQGRAADAAWARAEADSRRD